MTTHTRRTVLGGAVASAAAVSVAGGPAVAAAHSPGRRRRCTFVFAAGANGVSAGPHELALLGHRCVGVDLPGHRQADGQFRVSYQAPQDLAALATERSPLAEVTPADHVAATVDVVRRAAALGDPVILVGSSIGGATATLVADEVPRLVDTLVYDAAYCCTALATPNEYMSTPEAADSEVLALLGFVVADPAVVGAIRSNWRTADEALLAAAKHALLDDGTDAELLAQLNTMAPDELTSTGDTDARGNPRAWGRIPRAYIRHTRDRILPPALQSRMIAEADRLTPRNRFVVHDLDCAHLVSAARLGDYVRILDRIACGRRSVARA
ncbi:alpha/beta fold hydrolase [Prauserella muralis]|uniref:AB hydrolase-1 domain-containing protein n=1 Tax=Prauserella muralis TaxID=588067 RepID=A0A2V4B258_9PSEU|nr:alpha/beta fold hydrolase [Prauserella muralis]PXY22645.1 hypothetical protein BAY60_22770 [Prauserella muralis]TWE28356.1 pimeloyl-ACP methyl ester carboxylesterase [Prauserella muralis]